MRSVMQRCLNCSKREQHNRSPRSVSTVTALGLVRLVCQPKLMGAAVKAPQEASALLEALCQQPGVSLAAAEPGGW